MGATPLSGIEIPDLSDAANAPAFMATFGAAIEKYTIMRFTTVAAATAAITSPEERMIIATSTDKRLWIYSGSAWVLLGWYTTAGRPGVILTDAAQSFTTATAADITWGTEVSDVDGWTSGGSATLTVPSGRAGRYSVTYAGLWASTPGATNAVYCTIGGTILYAAPGVAVPGSTPVPVTISFTRALADGDTIKFPAYQSSGGSINLTSRLEIAWLGV